MTSKRRYPNKTEQVAILLRQAACACGCGQKFEDQPVEYHHQHERALGGADDADNWCGVRKDCHDRLTNGTKATTAGSSKHKIAKATRLEKARLALADAEKRTAPGFVTDKFSAPWTAGEDAPEVVDAFEAMTGGKTFNVASELRFRPDETGFLIPKPVRRPGKFPKRPPQRKGNRRDQKI